MFEKLLNAKICKLQSALVAKYGDCTFVTNVIRELTAQAKNSKNLACFDNYKV